jgi:hypothetical protein
MEKLHVFVNRKKVEFEQSPVTVAELLTHAGFAGNEWDLLQLQGEGDPTGGTLLVATQTIPLKNGLHFRVIPGNRTFGGR